MSLWASKFAIRLKSSVAILKITIFNQEYRSSNYNFKLLNLFDVGFGQCMYKSIKHRYLNDVFP